MAYKMVKGEKFVGGTHIRSANNLKEISPQNFVILKQENSELIDFAVKEFCEFFFKATGCMVESTTVDIPDKMVIVLGDTYLSAKYPFDKSNLKESRNGYAIKTVENKIFIYSCGDYGVLNGVYDLLSYLIGFNVFSETCIKYHKNLKTIPLYDFDIVEIPDFEWRMANYGVAKEKGSTVLARRLRMNIENDVWIKIGYYYHDTFNILPPDKYAKDHPDWYWLENKSDLLSYSKGGQLCYSNEEMRKQLVENLKVYIENNPLQENVTVTQEDNLSWCQCEKCRASKQKYGADSAVMIKFINKVYDDIQKWLKEKGDKRNLRIVFFAYNPTVDAPCYEKDGKYYPVDESVKLRDGVSVFYAPIEAYYEEDFYGDLNRKIYDNMLKWHALGDKMFLWVYSANFFHYLAPFDTWKSMQGIYEFSAKCGVKYIYDQAQMNNLNGTDFYHLKLYLNAKLQWNVNSDINLLTEEFFENYFGVCAGLMKKFLTEVQERLEYIQNNFVHFRVYTVMEKPHYYPQELLDRWIDLFDQAIKLAKDKGGDEGEILKDRVLLESIVPRYLKVMIYKNNGFNGDLTKFKEELKEDLLRLGITRVREGRKIEDFIENWMLQTEDEYGNII